MDKVCRYQRNGGWGRQSLAWTPTALHQKVPGIDSLGQITRQTRSMVAGTPCRSWHSPEDVLILSASQLLIRLARHRRELGMQVR